MSDGDEIEWDVLGISGMSGAFTTGNPSWWPADGDIYQSLIDAMSKMKAIPCPPEQSVVIETRPFRFVRAKPIEVVWWMQGLGMPSIVNDFEKWWAAQLLKHGLAKRCYLLTEAFGRPTLAGKYSSNEGDLIRFWHKK